MMFNSRNLWVLFITIEKLAFILFLKIRNEFWILSIFLHLWRQSCNTTPLDFWMPKCDYILWILLLFFGRIFEWLTLLTHWLFAKTHQWAWSFLCVRGWTLNNSFSLFTWYRSILTFFFHFVYQSNFHLSRNLLTSFNLLTWNCQ